MLTYEIDAIRKGYHFIAGVDEAGRGPLAGPVVAGGVILPAGFLDENIKDSKKLSERQREKMFDRIHSHALSIGIGIVDNILIDKINILQANKIAMKQAVLKLSLRPDLVLIDGRDKLDMDIEQTTIIKGDNMSQSIAAASIIAKVTRDRIMYKYHAEFPQYNFASHKGYGTRDHIETVKKIGPCRIHRKSFLKFLST